MTLAILGVSLSACVVQERVVVRRPPCPGGVWIGGHYDGAGFWHPAHWQCPRVVEVIR